MNGIKNWILKGAGGKGGPHMLRFLRYAVEHERKIRAVFLLDGAMVQKTVSVVSYDDETVSLRIGSKKTPVVLPLADLLSCDYARGDHGEE